MKGDKRLYVLVGLLLVIVLPLVVMQVNYWLEVTSTSEAEAESLSSSSSSNEDGSVPIQEQPTREGLPVSLEDEYTRTVVVKALWRDSATSVNAAVFHTIAYPLSWPSSSSWPRWQCRLCTTETAVDWEAI